VTHDPTSLKLLFVATIFLAGWLGGWIPLLRRQDSADSPFLSLGNAFAAGVFLGSGLIHLLSEAHESWTALGWDYPIAFVLAAAGFAIILLIEHVLLPEPAHELVHAHPGTGHAHDHDHASAHGAQHRLAPTMLVVALSFHSLVAGIALGIQDALGDLLVVFLAIVAHKSTEGFALGITLVRSGAPPKRSISLVTLLAVMTPLGALAGMSIGHFLEGTWERYLDATLLALAAGTFVYIAALDILQDEFLRPGSRFLKWLFASIGLATAALLAIWI
jgi:zinc transporter 1/2/3